MSDPEKARHLITNQRNQPVELHLPGGLIVLPPRGQAVVSEADLALPQLRVLRSGRLITTQELAANPKAELAPEPSPTAHDATTGGPAAEQQHEEAGHQR